MRTIIELLAYSWVTLLIMLLILRFLNKALGNPVPLLIIGLVLIISWAASIYKLSELLDKRFSRKEGN
ncbi:MAG: hypothetical protein ACP5NY_00115 [Thermocladium sp.]